MNVHGNEVYNSNRKQTMVQPHNRKLYSNETERVAAMCIIIGQSQNTGTTKENRKSVSTI